VKVKAWLWITKFCIWPHQCTN